MSVIQEQADWFSDAFAKLVDNVDQAILGKRHVIELVVTAMLSDGHVLLEDFPGTGKTVLAKALANTLDGTHSRIQFTPDLLPSDVTGVTIYDQGKGRFEFHRGPIFASIVLADEINRASPKTQSALLEVMEEGRVTVDGVSYEVGAPFMVIATQNPVEQAGTYSLPEAQLDRFLIKLSIGYPDREAEGELLDANKSTEAITRLGAVSSTEEVLAMQAFCQEVDLPDPVKMYIVDVCQATRTDPSLLMGASSRASISLVRASRVRAASQGRDVVLPDDVRALLPAVIEHRLILTPDAQLRDETVSNVLERILTRIPVPLGVGG